MGASGGACKGAKRAVKPLLFCNFHVNVVILPKLYHFSIISIYVRAT